MFGKSATALIALNTSRISSLLSLSMSSMTTEMRFPRLRSTEAICCLSSGTFLWRGLAALAATLPTEA